MPTTQLRSVLCTITRMREPARVARLPQQADDGGRHHPAGDRFVDWARTALTPLAAPGSTSDLHDLAPLGKMIGGATVVALGEAAHCAAEHLEFRNRLLQYLVKEKEFTAIAIESGIVESHGVHEYVRGAAGDLDAVVAQGIGWT